MSNGLSSDKKDAYIILSTGKKFYPYNPSAVELSIEDIAPAMLNVCRFSGQLKQDDTGQNKYYSLLQHSLVVSYLLSSYDTTVQIAGLLHDGEEVLGFPDVPSPVKAYLPEYKAAANVVQDYVGQQFGFKSPHVPQVKAADYLALCLEQRLWMLYDNKDPDMADIAANVNGYQDGFSDTVKDNIDTVMGLDPLDKRDRDKLLDIFIEHYYDLSFKEDFKKTGAL